MNSFACLGCFFVFRGFLGGCDDCLAGDAVEAVSSPPSSLLFVRGRGVAPGKEAEAGHREGCDGEGVKKEGESGGRGREEAGDKGLRCVRPSSPCDDEEGGHEALVNHGRKRDRTDLNLALPIHPFQKIPQNSSSPHIQKKIYDPAFFLLLLQFEFFLFGWLCVHMKERWVLLWSRKICGCGGCKTKRDCGKCKNCRDKPKFGGEGKRKKMCTLKVCYRAEAMGERDRNAMFRAAFELMKMRTII